MMIVIAAENLVRAAEISGGSSVVTPELVQVLFIGLGSLVSSIGLVIWGSRKTDKRIAKFREELKVTNDPLNISKVDKPVTRGECQQYRCALQKQIDEIGPALNRLFMKMDENDKRSEERAKDTHRRLDPILKSVSGNMARVDILERIVTAGKVSER